MNQSHLNLVIFMILTITAGCSTPDHQSGNGTDTVLSSETIDGNISPNIPVKSIDGVAEPVSEVESYGQYRSREQSSRNEEGRILMRKEMDASYEAVPQSAPARYYDGASLSLIRPASEPVDRENYSHFDNNPVKRVIEHPVSTFSIDVDTGSYSVVRRFLNNGQFPRKDAVRSEEMINYFSYDYPASASRSAPFAIHKEISVTPWNPDTHLLHIGIKGYKQEHASLPPANLVFLVDVSGSMQDANKLELLKKSLKLLTRELREIDSVAMVVYAGASGVVLEPTPGNEKLKITSALERLTAGGSTNGAAGIRMAYAMAEQAFKVGGINRVLLATDGDFNVGTVNLEQLKDLIEEKRKTGIALTTLGFGAGNYNDALMEQIADIGNGNYAYIDSLHEARKVLVDELGSTMLTIASDVKIQIEFNPAVVSEYRLIGYENRVLNREDFNNDKVDAGEIGAGHTVTAIYEVALVGSAGLKIDPLRYQQQDQRQENTDELAFLRLRYKDPDAETSQLLEWAINGDEILDNIEDSTLDFRFAAAVAAFGQLLRGGEQLGDFQYADILDLARASRGEDPFGYRSEFLSLVRLAESLAGPIQVGMNGE